MNFDYKHRILEHDDGSFEPQSCLACFFGIFCNPFSDWESSLIAGQTRFSNYEDAVRATKWRDDWGRGRLPHQQKPTPKGVHYL